MTQRANRRGADHNGARVPEAEVRVRFRDRGFGFGDAGASTFATGFCLLFRRAARPSRT